MATRTRGEPSPRTPFRRPAIGIAIATGGWFVAAAVLAILADRGRVLAPEASAVVAAAGTMLPLAIAVAAAGVLAGGGRIAASIGATGWRWTDLLLGGALGLALRAVVEAVWPTSQPALGGTSIASALVLLLGVVLVAPVVEEAFFRGLLLGALRDGLSRLGPLIAGGVSLLGSTAAFVALHAVAAPMAPSSLVGTALVGLGCGGLFLATGRVGGPIVAHAVSNGIGAVLLLT